MKQQGKREDDWLGFARLMLKVVAGFSLFLSGFVILLDPYDSLSFSLPLDRAPITTNQRYSYPTIARDLTYDSLVIGTSTSRMLEPALLDKALGARFANLAMNSGTPFEQSEILKLFLSAREKAGIKPKILIVGFDHVWCQREPYEMLTERPFPPWLYDLSPWNDPPHMLNYVTIEQAGRLVAYLTGFREANYGLDGYRNFLPPASDYDLTKVQASIYGVAAPRDPPGTIAFDPVAAPPYWLSSWSITDFPDLTILEEVLGRAPVDTQVILLNPPRHWTALALGSEKQVEEREACKALAYDLISAQGRPVFGIDFETFSDFTLVDENFWDSLHMTKASAKRVVETLGQAYRTRTPPQNGARVRF